MDRIVSAIAQKLPERPKAKRVAAYTRVSSGKDAMLHSLSAQVSYYSSMIQNHPGWEFCGVYSDEAITGTKSDRQGFQRMLDDCRHGKIDLILTKSISRFARNTVTLLQAVRELKELGIEVFFEEQNIHTLSADGELLLTILASYAQEESRSVSENMKWRIKKQFEQGIPWNGTLMGYRYEDGVFIVQPEEAKIVREIFDDYLSGLGVTAILKKLNAEGKRTRRGYTWCKCGVLSILRNYAYTGNLILQKTYRKDHISKRMSINNGELPKYHVEASHEPIVSVEQFMAVQRELLRRAEKHTHPGVRPDSHAFTGMLQCSLCGKNYRRKVTATGPVWICSTYNTKGRAACPSKQIPEGTLEAAAAEAMGMDAFDENVLHDKITVVRVEPGNNLVFCFKDGSSKAVTWKDRSRRESWTEEMRATARQRNYDRRGIRNA